MYDHKLSDSPTTESDVCVKGQMFIHGTNDFSSLEWMKRVKHKQDIMHYIGAWAKLLQLPVEDMRFEYGAKCVGMGCGKIVSMDRELERLGSHRKHVYICLLHRYVHCCDTQCTSLATEDNFEERICSIRAYWLVQSWIHDQLAKNFMCPEIELGSETKQAFSNRKFEAKCVSESCSRSFVRLDRGVWVCRTHGTPHICTYEQCKQKIVQDSIYTCWVTSRQYGSTVQRLGTETRKRCLVYTDRFGEQVRTFMDVPTFLPIGSNTTYLIAPCKKDTGNRLRQEVRKLSHRGKMHGRTIAKVSVFFVEKNFVLTSVGTRPGKDDGERTNLVHLAEIRGE